MLCESKGNLESSFELTYQTKRQLTFIGFALRRFASGIDYSIILPSIYFYLRSFELENYFLGFALAADTLFSFFLSPLLERLSQRWHRPRFLGFLANLLQIAGSLVYALSLRYYLPLVGRFISGLGQSFGATFYVEIKSVTSPEERSRVMVFMEGFRLFGVVIGPGLNFFLKDFNLTFGPWSIDRRTAPGFIMAIVWSIVEIVHIFTVYDLYRHPNFYRELPEQDDEDVPMVNSQPNTMTTTVSEGASKPGDTHSVDGDDGERMPEEPKTGDTVPDDGENRRKSDVETLEWSDEHSAATKHDDVLPGNDASIWELLFRRDVMLILMCQFLMFFNQTTFETLTILIGVNRLHFTIDILSIVFIVAGVEMVTVIIVVWSSIKSLDAKYLLVTSVSAGILASFARLAVAFSGDQSTGCLVMTLLMGIFTIVGTPVTSIAGKSLFPKLTPRESRGFYQTAFAISQHLGLLAGPLVTSALYQHLTLFSSITIGVFLCVYLMLLPTLDKMDVTAYGCGND